MKLTVKLSPDCVEVEVSVVPKYLGLHEQATMLAWAAARGIRKVTWKSPRGDVTKKPCPECGQPGAGANCSYCYQLRSLDAEPSWGQLSSEELEHRAQLAENMATRFASLAIDLAARAAVATHDPIEIEIAPTPTLDQLLASILGEMTSKYIMHSATGEQLDALAETHGIPRYSAAESDDSLRTRVRDTLLDRKTKQLTTTLGEGEKIRPGDRLRVGEHDVVVTRVEVSGGAVKIDYRALLDFHVDKIQIDGEVKL